MTQVPKYDEDELLDYDQALARYGQIPASPNDYAIIKFLDLDTGNTQSYRIKHKNESITYYKKYGYWWTEERYDDSRTMDYEWKTIIDGQEYKYSSTFQNDVGMDISQEEVLFQLLIQIKGYSFDDLIMMILGNTKNARKC